MKSSLTHLNTLVLTSACDIQNSDLCKRSTVNVLSDTSRALHTTFFEDVVIKADHLRTVCVLIRGYVWPKDSLVDNEVLFKHFHKCQFLKRYSNLTNAVGFELFFIRMEIWEDLFPEKQQQIVLLSEMNNLHLT